MKQFILRAASEVISDNCDVTPFSPVQIYRCFGGMYCLIFWVEAAVAEMSVSLCRTTRHHLRVYLHFSSMIFAKERVRW
jgi:hypothetical protein